jgi:hypothetical protein
LIACRGTVNSDLSHGRQQIVRGVVTLGAGVLVPGAHAGFCTVPVYFRYETFVTPFALKPQVPLTLSVASDVVQLESL